MEGTIKPLIEIEWNHYYSQNISRVTTKHLRKQIIGFVLFDIDFFIPDEFVQIICTSIQCQQ